MPPLKQQTLAKSQRAGKIQPFPVGGQRRAFLLGWFDDYQTAFAPSDAQQKSKADEAQTGDVRTGDAQQKNKADEVQTGDAQTGDALPSDVQQKNKADEAQTGDAQPGNAQQKKKAGEQQKKTKAKAKADAGDEEAAAPKKRGNKGDFHGQRLAFLNENLAEYITALPVWYWQKFPWYLPLNEELADDMEPDTMLDIDLTDEEAKQKGEVLTKMEGKLEAWFNYRRAQSDGSAAKNPWTGLIAKMRRAQDAPPPKHLPDFQVYMQQADVRKKIKALMEGQHPGGTVNRGGINLHGAIARELLENETEEECKRVHKEGDEAHEAAIAEQKAAQDERVLLSEEDMVESVARKCLPAMVAPLLKLIADAMGYHCSLIVGWIYGEGNKKYEIRSMHEGRMKGPNPQDWKIGRDGNKHAKQFSKT
ncbi:hypothetical protein FB451DRAFT_1385225 [Mycena latifolia]|nr:hypothetical protein FB451DRAFT_1385225 [Mycena latifolia]